MRLRITTMAPLKVVPIVTSDPWSRVEAATPELLERIEAGAEATPAGYRSRADYATHVRRSIGSEPWPPCRSFDVVGSPCD